MSRIEKRMATGPSGRPTRQEFVWGVAEKVLAGLIVAGTVAFAAWALDIWDLGALWEWVVETWPNLPSPNEPSVPRTK